MITASKMEKWLECNASEKLIQIRNPDSEWAQMGRDDHVVLADRTLAGDFDEALGLDVTRGAWSVERAVVWNPFTKDGRRIDAPDRSYPAVLAGGEIPGTYDGMFISHDQQFAMILDHKTGSSDAQRADRNCQLLFFAGWAMDVLGIKRFRLVLSYTRGDKARDADPTFEYADIGEAEIEAYRRRIFAARDNTYLATDTRPGTWCAHCESKLDCVSRNGSLKLIVGKFISGVVTLDDIPLHWHKLKQIESVVADALAQMKQLVIDADEPVPLPGGRMLVATKRKGASKMNGDIAHQVLLELHGRDVAEAAVERISKVTRDSIQRSLDLALSTTSKAKMMQEIEEAVANLGGISRGDEVTVVKEVNDKE